MTAKTFRMLTWGYMLLVVLTAGVIGALVPGIPTWAFIVGGLALGSVLLLLGTRILKRNDLILKDERSRRNSEKAMAWAYRIGTWAMIAAIAVLDIIPAQDGDGNLVSRTLVAVLVIQYALFMGYYVFLDRRDLA